MDTARGVGRGGREGECVIVKGCDGEEGSILMVTFGQIEPVGPALAGSGVSTCSDTF